MSVGAWLYSAGLATGILVVLMSGSQVLGLSRMSFPLLLGTFFTPKRDLALVFGTVAEVILGFVFALAYIGVFEWRGGASWWLGGLGGALHGALLLLVILPLLPGLHPRMASERQGPEPTRGLEPPGLLGCNYGLATPAWTFAAHLVYGVLLASLYRGG